jgi:tripartite ATP-independent transporter DctM subunit
MALIAFLVTLFAFLPLGIPIAFILLICCMVLMLVLGNFSAFTMAQNIVTGMNSSALMAIPFFMLAGEIMSQGGLSKRIVDFANILVGSISGGLGYATIIASIIFAGLSGSPVADAAALGAILIPMMVAAGYDRDISTALVCSAAIIAPIIPPSVPMIVLGSAVGVSVTQCFMAGIFPGLVIGVGLMVIWYFIVKRKKYKGNISYTREEKKKIFFESLPTLVLPVIIVGGIRFGIVTATEAGAVACVYALLISLFVYKEITLKDLVNIAVVSGSSTAIVMFIVGCATSAGWLITVAKIPDQFAAMLGPVVENQLLLLVVVNIFFMFMGMVMDLTPNLLIFGPVIFPVIIKAGIDPVYFAVLMVYNLCIGLITPPVGTIIYLGCSVGQTKFERLVKSMMPFVIAEFAVLFLFIFIPQLIRVPAAWLK